MLVSNDSGADLPPPVEVDCVAKCLAEEIGLGTVAGVGVGASGLPLLPKPRPRLFGSGSSTSVSSMTFRTLLGDTRVPRSLGGRGFGTASLGGVLGRSVPVVGWGVVTADLIAFQACVFECESQRLMNRRSRLLLGRPTVMFEDAFEPDGDVTVRRVRAVRLPPAVPYELPGPAGGATGIAPITRETRFPR